MIIKLSTIPMERKATEGSPQNVFSRLFYQYQMSFSLLGRSRSVPFLNCCPDSLQEHCKAVLQELPAAAASWEQGIIVMAVCAFLSSFHHKFHIPSQMFSHGATPSQYQIFHLFATFTVGALPLWSCQHPTTSRCLFCLLTMETQFQSHLIWVY